MSVEALEQGFAQERETGVFARAGEPKQLLWRDLPHVAPDTVQVVTALAEVVLAELRDGQ